MIQLPQNAKEIRNPLNATEHPGALIGYVARARDGQWLTWTIDFDDVSTDSPAPVYLGAFLVGATAHLFVEDAYIAWAAKQAAIKTLVKPEGVSYQA